MHRHAGATSYHGSCVPQHLGCSLYLWRWRRRSLMLRLLAVKQTAKIEPRIGTLPTTVSTPRCLTCGRPSHFQHRNFGLVTRYCRTVTSRSCLDPNYDWPPDNALTASVGAWTSASRLRLSFRNVRVEAQSRHRCFGFRMISNPYSLGIDSLTIPDQRNDAQPLFPFCTLIVRLRVKARQARTLSVGSAQQNWR